MSDLDDEREISCCKCGHVYIPGNSETDPEDCCLKCQASQHALNALLTLQAVAKLALGLWSCEMCWKTHADEIGCEVEIEEVPCV